MIDNTIDALHEDEGRMVRLKLHPLYPSMMGGVLKGKKKNRFTIRLSDGELEELGLVSRLLRVSRSDFIRFSMKEKTESFINNNNN